MSRGVKILIGFVGMVLLVTLIGVALCTFLSAPARSSEPWPTPAAMPEPGGVELPNPASVYCEEQDGRLEIRTATDGGQYGVCIFADGSECDEWALFRNECGPGN